MCLGRRSWGVAPGYPMAPLRGSRMRPFPSVAPKGRNTIAWGSAPGTPMHPLLEHRLLINRRHFFGRTATGIGLAALASLLEAERPAAAAGAEATGGLPGLPHFTPKAKRVIYLFQS